MDSRVEEDDEVEGRPLFTGRQHLITTTEALKILKNTSHDKCCSFLPHHPTIGTIYLYKPNESDDTDGWKHDGYKWKHQGLMRLPRNRTPLLQKRYFHGINKDGSLDRSRRKDVFCLEEGTDPHHLALIHYIGKMEEEGPGSTENFEEMEQTETSRGVSMEAGSKTEIEPTQGPSSDEIDPAASNKTPLKTGGTTMTPDLAAAMETMKAALAAQESEEPVMEMFNTLFESVCSNLKNPDVEYCLLVSDKKSGKSSLIGTKEGKELACKTPEMAQKTKGLRKSQDTTPSEESAENEIFESDAAIDNSDMEDAVPAIKRKVNSPDQDAPAVKRKKTVNRIADKITKMKGDNACSKSLIEQSKTVVVQQSPKSQVEIIARSGSKGKILDKVKISEDELVTNKSRKIVVGKVIPEKNIEVLKDGNNAKVKTPTPSPILSRSSRSTRNIKTPNWKDVLSGKVSIRDESERKPDPKQKTVTLIVPNTSDKSDRKPAKEQNDKGEKKIKSSQVLKNNICTETKSDIDKKLDTVSMKTKPAVKTNMKESAKNINFNDSKKQNVSEMKECSVKLIAIKETKNTVENEINRTNVNISKESKVCEKELVNEKIGTKADKPDQKPINQPSQPVITGKIHQKKDKDMADKGKEDTSKPQPQGIETNKNQINTPRTRGRPKGSRNKTQEDDDNDFETTIEVLNYTGQSGRPKQTSIRVKIELEEGVARTGPESDESKELSKRNSKKSVACDSVPVDEIKLSDEEDILEWKGVGETKKRGRGRPKGSFLKKYETVTEPMEPEENLKATLDAKQGVSNEESNGTGLRTSSRLKSYLCEVCAENFSLKYLLDEHYRMEHPNEKTKSELNAEGIEKQERRTEAMKIDDDGKGKDTEVCDKKGDDKDIDSADEYQDAEDKDWKISDENIDDGEDEDYDEDDDFHVENKRMGRQKRKIENKPGQHTCPECLQKFKSLVSLQVHKIKHMKKELAFECVACKQKFLTRNDLQFHSQTAHKVDYGTLMYFGFIIADKKIQCEICSEDFESMDSYHDHRPVHLTLKHFCRSCGHGFDSSDELAAHVASKCAESRKHLQCEACKETFDSHETRKKHIKEKHTDKNEFICHFCGLTKEDKESLRICLNSHEKEKIFKCETCEKCFFDKRNLLDHRRTHSDLEEAECPTCFKKLGSQRSLQIHMHRHTMKKKLPCKFCDQRFESKESCLEHEKTHEENQENDSQEHKCTDCGRIFSNKNRLQRHSQIHFKERSFECIFCEEKFQTGSDLLVHKKTKHPDQYRRKKVPKVLICEHCGFETTHKQRLERHLQVHNSEKLFECEFCGKKFQTLTSCSSHKMIHRGRVRQPGLKFKCQWASCNMEYLKPATLRRHLNSHMFKVASGREDCDCQECAVVKTGGTIHGSSLDNLEQIGSEVVLGETTSDKLLIKEEYREPRIEKSDSVKDTLLKPKPSMDILQEAISQIEEAENDAEQRGNDVSDVGTETHLQELNHKEKPTFPCAWCKDKFSTRCKLLDHFSTEHPQKHFPSCEECNKVYLDKKNLKEHMTVHTGVKSFKCEECDRVFRTRTSLRQHSHIHSENKPFVCSFCGHGFAQRGYFNEHVRRHKGDKPYVCHICSKSFFSNNLLKRHMYMHTGCKPHQCSECGKEFLDKSQLIIHLRTHINYRPFQCGRCDKSFYANGKLMRHLATVHHIDKRTLSDYFPTKVNKGVGWRHKNKKNKDQIKPDTQYVVYIDQHGNIISRVETRPMDQRQIAPNIKDQGSDENVDMETQTQEDDTEESELDDDIDVKAEKEEAKLQNIQTVNKPKQGFIPLDGSIEVHTKRDQATGNLQIYTIPQGEKKTGQDMGTGFTAEELSVVDVTDINVAEGIEVFQMVTSEADAGAVQIVQMQTHNVSASQEIQAPTELNEMGTGSEDITQYTTVVDGVQTDIQHIEFIPSVSVEQTVDDLQIENGAEILTESSEQATALGNQNIQIQYDETHEETNVGNVEQLAQNISINIGEDGTVNLADLEKIEALRNLYSDQQIVIVLENQNQQ